jgi:hypothetical protein
MLSSLPVLGVHEWLSVRTQKFSGECKTVIEPIPSQ